MQIGILECNQFSKKAICTLETVGKVELFDEDKNNLADFLSDKDVIFVRLKHFLGKVLLSSAKQLKYICSPTTGHNHLDVEYLDARGIQIIPESHLHLLWQRALWPGR